MQQHPLHSAAAGGAALLGRIVGGVFGLVFFGIGLTMIGFVWLGGDGFGDPPVFFKLIASFIALAFVAMGGSLAVSAIFGGALLARRGEAIMQTPGGIPSPQPSTPPTTPGGYACSHCGAALAAKTEVSPMGDTKCAFCGQWFNVHWRG